MIYIEQITPILTWQLRRDVLYPNEFKHNMGLAEDEDGIHFGAFKDNKLVGIISLFQNGADFQFRKLAIDPSTQKMGVGNSLLQWVINYARENGGNRIWCNARDTAFGFYLKAGFAFTGQVFSKGSINYEIMEKVFPALSNDD
ncbi:GNAT family N-acetyltransferase [Mucilaginibacter sp. X4EP1]|uniref:GNAT family N-acetyltransferase n=1 Tax=Mucilaginibacter sp. X4EP1 TaxID=2723092 RepID=UPI0021691D20|nr:GNAT family N-acetyltransferase [Mucilaginibacter sp. X4EP1]MCS3813644.1 GNAT superfamily N-acetyltransferase [Mucilaginibacter sp. X4EP1]